jgi:hypothetical protein
MRWEFFTPQLLDRTIYVETRGADFHEGGPAQTVHALSYSEVEEIATLFVESVDRIVHFAQHLSFGGAGPRVVSRKRFRGTLTE